MDAIVLDPMQQSKVMAAGRELMVQDQSGKVLGYFLTPEAYSKFLAKTCEIP